MAVVSLKEYKKALQALEFALQMTEQSRGGTSDVFELNRDASIQRFEFCVELAWKTSLKILGIKATSPKEALRDMLKSKLISDFDLWFDFLVARNKSSHTYDEKIAEQVYASALVFLPEGKNLLKILETL